MDEQWVAIACFADEEWSALVEAMGSPAWATDAKFASHADRKENEDELDAKIGAWTADKDPYALMNDLQGRGAAAPPTTAPRLLCRRHLAHCGLLRRCSASTPSKFAKKSSASATRKSQT
jgi:crotonobetainyl-CoA:carnitine CoA-transferase CaiB-like acyl-CoA transferase